MPAGTPHSPSPRRRSFGPEWKALRLYFGTAIAAVIVFVVVQRLDFLYPQARSTGHSAPPAGDERLEMLELERHALIESVEEAKGQLAQRKAQQERARAAYEKELVARELDLVREAVALRQLEEDNGYAPAMLMDANAIETSWSTPTPQHVGAVRTSGGIDLASFDLPAEPEAVSEPETVPANEDEFVTLEPFEVSAPYATAGYRATATLAGTRLNTTLRDVGSAVTFDTEANAGGVAARAQSSYRHEPARADASATAAPGSVESVWAAGFAAAPSVSVATTQVLRDTAATDNRTLLAYTTSAEVAGADSGRGALAAPPPPRVPDQVTPAPAADPAPVRAPVPFVVPWTIDEAHAAREPVSTFSLHVGDTSFKLAQAALARGQLPDARLIRPEEFYNAFDYADPTPTLGQKIACRIEQAAHPFLQQRRLVRVAMKVANTGRGGGQPLRLTVLLDTSGSMERDDRAASVRRAMEVLASLLGPDDRVTLIGFARRARLLAEALPGDQAAQLVDLARRTPADGGTNIEEALQVAEPLARRHFAAAAQNRLVLLTDGAANLGNADPSQLAARIEALRGHGIAFDACGVGTDGLDDAILEALTRRGDGRYYVLDSPEEADAAFARQLAGAFRPAAKDVKVQVRFNPARVGAYRLLGFEKHRLREEDFRNDRVDAAELAAEEAAVAVYQVEVLPQGEGDLGEVFVRFRDMAVGGMVERSWPISHDRRVRGFDQATPSLQLAGTAALLAEVIRGGAIGDQVDLDALAPVVGRLKGHYTQQPRVQELAAMFDQLRRATSR